MACFARKLRYGACDGDSGASYYFALVELARKKGGRPSWFVLYRRAVNFLGGLIKNKVEMITLGAETTEEAIRRFWPSDEEGMGSEFPGHGSNRWRRTTLWLNHVAAGGAHECFGYKNDMKGIRLGTWAKIGTPALRRERRKRRKKKPLQVGNLAHILLKYQALLHNLTEEKYRLGQKLAMVTSHDKGSSYVVDDDDEEEEEYYLVSDDIKKVDDEIASVYADIDRTKKEMRYIVRKMFPKPMELIPKRVLRYERERKDMKLSGW